MKPDYSRQRKKYSLMSVVPDVSSISKYDDAFISQEAMPPGLKILLEAAL